MSKKKLLKESQVRRFMGLAGIESNLVSNHLKEMSYYEDEKDVSDEEPPPMDEPMDEPPMDEPDMGEPAMDEPMDEPMDAPMDEPAGEIDQIPKEIRDSAFMAAAEELASALGVDASFESDGEPKMDEPEMDEPAMDEPPMDEPAEEPPEDEEEPEVMEELSGVNLELSEEEIVQEVARRVARRIIEAKKSYNKMNEALGHKGKQRKK